MGVVMAVGAIAYVMLTVTLATRVIAPASRLSNALDTRMGGVLADALGANAVVKSFGAEAREDARLARVIDKWSRRTQRTWMRHTWSGTGQLALLWVVRSAVTATALWLWWQGRATPGEITYVLTTYFVVHGYLRDIGQHVHHLQRAVNEMEELVQLYDEPLGVADSPDARPLQIDAGEVRFDHVTFCYAGQDTPLYRDLNVRIAPGERIGLVGHSGSGKTTFVKLIQRLYDVTEGRVLIDGQNVAHATQESLRSQIAIVQQEPILFHRSLAENIAYARPEATHGGDRAGGAAGECSRLHRAVAAWLSDAGGRARREALGWRASACGAGAGVPGGCADPDPGRGDFEPGFGIGSADSAGDGSADVGTHVHRHRASVCRRCGRWIASSCSSTDASSRKASHETLLRRPHGHYRRLFERQSGGIVGAVPGTRERLAPEYVEDDATE